MVAPESTIVNIQISSHSIYFISRTTMNKNFECTTAQPDDTAINIEHSCSSTKTKDQDPHSTSISLMDNASMISECQVMTL